MIGKLAELDARWSAELATGMDNRTVRRLAALFAHSGDSWFWLAGLVLLALASTGMRQWALQVAGVIFVAAALVLLIKFTVRRGRPQGTWGEIYRRSDPHSFPSGHAVRAVLLAALAAGWGPAWLAPVLIVWAPLVLWARVALGLHFLSDVVAGAILGLGLAAAGLWALPAPL